MDDVFVERLIAKKPNAKEILIKAAIILGVAAVFIIAMRYFRMLAPLLILGAAFGGWVLWTRTNIEYEYSLSNGELTFDVIYGQQKRKKLKEINLREKVEVLAPVSNDFSDDLNRNVSQNIDYSSSPSASGRYFMIINGEKGFERIFFEPDEKMLKSIRKVIPSKVKGI